VSFPEIGWLPFLIPASYSTPNRQPEKQKIIKVGGLLPAGGIFASVAGQARSFGKAQGSDDAG